MRKLPTALLLLAGCAGAARDPLPDYAPLYRPSTPVAAPAPEPPPGRLALDEALALAERLHPEIAAARARVEAAEGRALQAGLLPNPVLLGRMESAPFKERTASDAEYLAGVSQDLPVGGRLSAAREAGRLEAARRRREAELQRLEILVRVRGAFATALFASEAAALRGELLALAARGTEIARSRRQAGDAAADELARAELEEARARLEAGRARSLRELAFVALASAVGSPELRLDGVEGRLEAAFELPALASVLAELENGAHAALGRADVDAARGRIELARAERVPNVTLDLLYRRIEGTRTDAFDVGLSVPLPLFDRNQGRLREARAERREAEARARATRGEAVRGIRAAHAKLAEALLHERLSREEIVPRAKTVLEAVEARHAAGDLSLADVLPVRRDHASIRLAYLESLREAMEAWGELRPYLDRWRDPK